MQDQMVRRETLAALGELVGGLMHELSTPIGTAITSLSYLDTEVKSLTSETEADTSVYDEAYNITFSNLERAITNIDTFRIINMDQATLEMRRIKVDDYMKEIILSLKPKLKKTSHHIDLKCDPQLFAVTTPGILSQIMTNLILNSLKHGFEGIQSGHITIDISKSGQTLT
ncbi:hybrid sensor histidine kinase/response regulator, partial [Aduncisulcus paluster]